MFSLKQKLDQKGFSYHLLLPIVVIGIVAAIGSYVLEQSRAATISTQINVPTNLNLNAASTTSAALIWSRSTTAGVTYNILRNNQLVGTTDTYTANYLDTGLTPGTAYSYTITAKNSQGTSLPSTALAVTTGSTAIPITKCNTKITAPGNYVLTGDINFVKNGGIDTFAKCITVTNTNHVSIDCQGHIITISGNTNANFYTLTSVNHFLLTNCTDVFAGTATNNFSDLWTSLISNATFEKNTFGNSYKSHGKSAGDNITGTPTTTISNNVVKNNKFLDANIEGSYITQSYIGFNTITWDAPTGAGVNTGYVHGTNNIIDSNFIVGNGVYSPTSDFTGIDDNISLGIQDGSIESGDIVANNIMAGSFDCGIETLGTISNMTIINNTIVNFGINAICAYYNTSWQNNVLLNNTATQGNTTDTQPSFLTIFDANPPYPAGTKVYFKDNFINGNKFTAKSNNPGCGVHINFTNTTVCNYPDATSTSLNSSNTILSGNIFSNNNFGHIGTMHPPALTPSVMIIDGGGNICNNKNPNGTPPNPPNGIVCQ